MPDDNFSSNPKDHPDLEMVGGIVLDTATDAELAEISALECMGWVPCSSPIQARGDDLHTMWDTGKGAWKARRMSSWDPANDLNDAAALDGDDDAIIVGRIGSHDIDDSWSGKRWECRRWLEGLGRPLFGRGGTEGRARTIAAIAAIRAAREGERRGVTNE